LLPNATLAKSRYRASRRHGIAQISSGGPDRENSYNLSQGGTPQMWRASLKAKNTAPITWRHVEPLMLFVFYKQNNVWFGSISEVSTRNREV
jgi:hypothetical protein